MVSVREPARYNDAMQENATVPALTIQPTTKFLKAGPALATLIFLALEVMCLTSWNTATGTPLIMVLPLLILIWPTLRALRWRFTKTTISGDRLRYETGIASKSTRNIQLSKLQDVRVDQRLLQRLFDIG